MSKTAFEEHIASLPWIKCKMDANSEEVAFFHLDTKMYGIPDDETPEYYFYDMINEMIADAKMPFDLRVELSSTVHSMNQNKTDLQSVLRDSDMAWSIYKAAAFTPLFRYADAHISALHDVVFDIRELYPGWPILNTDEERKALALSKSHVRR